jgi:hypothetical protein
MKKILVIGIILLFIGISFAPSINTGVVKASQNDDLVEVTTQACGIQGYGNTTVKLTREQYQNLEQYLVEFRARLNQTSTREEAVPIFKDAVVELDKYGLLPRGMSVELAQRLILGKGLSQRTEHILQDNKSNYFCLTFGKATGVLVNTIPLTILFRLLDKIGFFLYLPLIVFYFLGMMVFTVSPIYIDAKIGFGFKTLGTHQYVPSTGWIFTLGLNGIKIWNDSFRGDLNIPFQGFLSSYYPGITGFTGFHLYFINEDMNYFLGTSLWVKITTEPPD